MLECVSQNCVMKQKKANNVGVAIPVAEMLASIIKNVLVKGKAVTKEATEEGFRTLGDAVEQVLSCVFLPR